MAKKLVIIGGGIIGNAIARELALRKAGDITLLEKEPEVGMHSSGRMSGVIHSGVHWKRDVLASVMCVEGSRMLRDYCREHGVKMEECGTLLVAQNEEEKEKLKTLQEYGRGIGVPGLKLLEQGELKEREPAVKGIGALLSRTGAIVDQKGLVKTIAAEAASLGVEYRTNAKVVNISRDKEGKLFVFTPSTYVQADFLINAAGLYADKLAHMMGVGKEYTIIPFRGEYMQINNSLRLHSMVYPVPDDRFPFKGVHLTRTIDGKIIAGPTAALSYGRESYEKERNLRETLEMAGTLNFWAMIASRERLKLAYDNAKISRSKSAFLEKIRALVEPEISLEDITPYRAGIRAQLVDRNGELLDEMKLVHNPERYDSLHILNPISPSFTNSLYFAQQVGDMVQKPLG